MQTSDASHPEPTDSALMLAVRDGDLARLGPLFERYHRRLYGFCLRITRSPQVSEDLVQEVFTRILRYRHTFHPEGDFSVWIYRLARNVCNDHFRKSGRGGPHIPIEDALPGTRELASTGPLASDALESAEARSLLRVALDRLPDDKRELLELSRFQGMRYAQIGELIGCSTGAVKVRVHRAIKQLRDVYSTLASEVPS